jgi:hypothetical protein
MATGGAGGGDPILGADSLPVGDEAGGFSRGGVEVGGRCRPTRPGWQGPDPIPRCRQRGNRIEKREEVKDENNHQWNGLYQVVPMIPRMHSSIIENVELVMKQWLVYDFALSKYQFC